MDRYRFNSMGIPMDKLEDEHEQSGYNEWDDLTQGSVPAFNGDLNDEVARLLDNPSELLDASIDDVTAIYKNHHSDLLDLGELINWYYRDLAIKQAKEYI